MLKRAVLGRLVNFPLRSSTWRREVRSDPRVAVWVVRTNSVTNRHRWVVEIPIHIFLHMIFAQLKRCQIS